MLQLLVSGSGQQQHSEAAVGLESVMGEMTFLERIVKQSYCFFLKVGGSGVNGNTEIKEH